MGPSNRFTYHLPGRNACLPRNAPVGPPDARNGREGDSPLASGVLVFCLLPVGAAMCSAFDAAFTCAAGHNAFRAGQVPTISSHSKCNGQNGFS